MGGNTAIELAFCCYYDLDELRLLHFEIAGSRYFLKIDDHSIKIDSPVGMIKKPFLNRTINEDMINNKALEAPIFWLVRFY